MAHIQFYATANFAAPTAVATTSLNKIATLMTTGPLAKILMFASLLSYCLVTHYNVRTSVLKLRLSLVYAHIYIFLLGTKILDRAEEQGHTFF